MPKTACHIGRPFLCGTIPAARKGAILTWSRPSLRAAGIICEIGRRGFSLPSFPCLSREYRSRRPNLHDGGGYSPNLVSGIDCQDIDSRHSPLASLAYEVGTDEGVEGRRLLSGLIAGGACSRSIPWSAAGRPVESIPATKTGAEIRARPVSVEGGVIRLRPARHFPSSRGRSPCRSPGRRPSWRGAPCRARRSRGALPTPCRLP